LLLDASAWARAVDGRLTGEARTAFDDALGGGDLWTCPLSLLEMRYSATDDFAAVAAELDALDHAPLGADASAMAVRAQAELACTPGISHRVKPVDLLIAAVAADSDAGVLHYDHDYDLIAEHTSLDFDSVWVAERGSIG
jgi:predicted nucleic acid-binding protein